MVDSDFTKLLVSTTTVTYNIFREPVVHAINIIGIAKYLELDNCIIGIKLVYASGNSTVLRGTSRISKKRNDFYNQVTFTIILSNSVLVSCKLFHNGTLHITGSRTLEETKDCCFILLSRLQTFKTAKMIRLVPNVPYLKSFDNLLFSVHGDIIGWSNQTYIYMYGEYVVIEVLNDTDTKVFVSVKWNNLVKNIYTMGCLKMGTKTLQFYTNSSKRHFDVKFGYIYCNNKIIGKEITELAIPIPSEILENIIEKGYLLYYVESFVESSKHLLKSMDIKTIESDTFNVHMINTFFKAPFAISRVKLHKTLLHLGYYSRYDPCSNAAVNFRFHYNDNFEDINQCGKCPETNKLCCGCKQISVSCFNSGKMNITGLLTIDQGYIVYDFIKYFFIKHKDSFCDDMKTLELNNLACCN